ncbi:MAG TPA: YedE family putative selenium transporter [Planctomycetota bacterium]|nr:YedE family putative selenium transporter [Planctomycetota bacterium]
MLRGEATRSRRLAGLLLAAGVGAAAGILVWLGNPANMGICGACFLRDVAGALGLQAKGPAIFRPEIAGVVLGAFGWSLASRRGGSRSGGYAGMRFLLCLFMSLGALVFLGCPFRMLQRLGGGDPTAWAALPGFLAGVGAGMWIERRGKTIGTTQPAPWIVGLAAPLAVLGLLALFLAGVLVGPGPGDVGPPAHANWLIALGIALAVGVALSATGFCAVSAARQVFRGPRWMLGGAAALVAGYALVVLLTGKPAFGSPAIAHSDWLWNVLGLGLAGLTGALAGGCPVRQIVMAGEGNADAFCGCAGLVAGGALAHTLGPVSIVATATDPGGATLAGKVAVGVGITFALVYGLVVTRAPASR